MVGCSKFRPHASNTLCVDHLSDVVKNFAKMVPVDHHKERKRTRVERNVN